MSTSVACHETSDRAERRERFSKQLRLIALPIRVEILDVMGRSLKSPVAISRELPHYKIGRIAYHMRQLHQAGLLELVTTRQRRGATEHFYRAEPIAAMMANQLARLFRNFEQLTEIESSVAEGQGQS